VAATRRRVVLILALIVLAIPLFLILATGVAVWNAAHTDDASRVDEADAIVVLGAAQYQGEPSPVFQGRLDGAKILYEQGRAGVVLVIGGALPGDRTTEAEAGRDYLLEQGLPDGSVVAIPEGNTTLESLEATSEWMHRRDMDSVFLVSDPWHNLRIKRMAGDLGLTPYVSATWHSAAVSQETRLPGYLREIFAYLYYRIFGR
jgi:uncharacterized SAM-binding protein YcdF (DUF218 family)